MPSPFVQTLERARIHECLRRAGSRRERSVASVFVPQLLQQQQMVPDSRGHGGVLPVGYAEFLCGLLHDPGQRSVVGVADVRAQVMDDVMIQAAYQPADQRILRCVVRRRGEDVVDAVFKLAAMQGKYVSSMTWVVWKTSTTLIPTTR